MPRLLLALVFITFASIAYPQGQGFGSFPPNGGWSIKAALPGTCGMGDGVFLTTAVAGSNWYMCTAPNTWTPQSGAGAGGGLTAVSGTAHQLTSTVVSTTNVISFPADLTLVLNTLLTASTTAGPSLNMPSGVAPTTPVNGDIWNQGGVVKFYYGAVTQSLVFQSRLLTCTAPLTGCGDLSADRTLSIPNAAADGATKGAAGFAAADFDAASGIISIDYTNGQKATTSLPGFLSAPDWTTFNAKAPTASPTFTGLATFSSQVSTVRVGLPNSPSLPGTCVVGDLYFKSDATAGQNIHECASTNVWTQQLNSGGGGGGGDFSTGLSVSIDSEIMLFSGTGGKTGKRATGTGIIKAASGVYGIASAGDFPTLNQNTTGTALQATVALSLPATSQLSTVVLNTLSGIGKWTAGVPGIATQNDISGSGYAVGGGTAQAQAVTLSPAIASVAAGTIVCWAPAAANTGAGPTLAINGLTPINITKWGTVALIANDIITSAIACARYDGTQMELLNPQTDHITGLSVSLIPKASGATGLVNSSITDNGSTVSTTLPFTALSIATGSSPPTITGGTAGGDAYGEGTAPTGCAVGVDMIFASSTQHGFLTCFNNGSTLPLVQGPASNVTGRVAGWSGTNGGLLVDAGFLYADVVRAVAPGVGLLHFAGSTQVGTSSLIVNADITNATIDIAAKSNATGTPSSTTVLFGNNTWGTVAAGGGGVNAQTISYTLLSTDAGKVVTENGSSLTTTLPASPSATFASGIKNLNSTPLIIARNGNTINGGTSNITLTQYQDTACYAGSGDYVCGVPYVAGTGIGFTAATNGITIAVTGYANLVNATSPGAGFAKFAGSTQTVISAAILASELPNVNVLISTTGAVTDPGNSMDYQFNNASGALTFNVPVGVAGLQRCYRNATGKSGAITLQMATSNTVDVAGANGSSAGTLVSGGALGDSVCLVSDAANHWYAYKQLGTWTNN